MQHDRFWENMQKIKSCSSQFLRQKTDKRPTKDRRQASSDIDDHVVEKLLKIFCEQSLQDVDNRGKNFPQTFSSSESQTVPDNKRLRLFFLCCQLPLHVIRRVVLSDEILVDRRLEYDRYNCLDRNQKQQSTDLHGSQRYQVLRTGELLLRIWKGTLIYISRESKQSRGSFLQIVTRVIHGFDHLVEWNK